MAEESTAEQYAIERIDAARQALAQAKSIEDVKVIRDKAEAIRVWYANQRGCLNVQNDAAEIKLLAERRLGELLGPPEQGKRTDLTSSSLEEVEIPDASAHRWRVEASVPETDFRRYVAEQRDKQAEVTSTGLYMLGRRQQIPEPVETPPLPEGHYHCIVIDPPWPIQKIEREVAPNQGKSLDYPIMEIEKIAGLNIPSLVAEDGAWIFLWTTQRFLDDASQIMSAWGCRRIFTMVWCKPGGFQPFGLPQYDVEFVHVGRIGSLSFKSTKAFGCWFEAPRGKHSEKPDSFYELLDRVTAPRRLDMFARKERKGFEVWGKE